MALNLWAASESTKKDVLVEFRAGKMNYSQTTKIVDADKRKGLVQLKQNAEDNLIRFLWKDRTTGTDDINLIIFPGEATFRKVEEAKARVYVLEWKGMLEKKLFFWLQEPSADKDKEYCDNINKFINEPPQPASPASGLGGLGGIDQGQLRQLLQAGGFGGMDPSQLFQMIQSGEGLGGGGSAGRQARTAQRSAPSTGSTGAASSAPSLRNLSPPVSHRILQNILDGLISHDTPTESKQTDPVSGEKEKVPKLVYGEKEEKVEQHILSHHNEKEDEKKEEEQQSIEKDEEKKEEDQQTKKHRKEDDKKEEEQKPQKNQ